MTTGSALMAANGARSASCQRRRVRRGVSSWSWSVNSRFSKKFEFEVRASSLLLRLVRILVGVGHGGDRRIGISRDVGFGNFVEGEFAWSCLWFCVAAEIAGDDSGLDDGGD